MKFLCVGQAICDLYLHPVTPAVFERHDNPLDGIPVYGGGDANNASIDLKRIGGEVALATSLGADTFGHQVLKLLQQEGVDTRFVSRRADLPTSVHVIMLSGDENLRGNAYLKGTGQAVERKDIPDEAIEWADHVHCVSVLSQPLLDGEGVASILKYAKSLGKTTSMDLQLDNDLWTPEECLEKVAQALPYCDVFLPSIDEAKVVAGTDDPLELKEFFGKYGIKIFGVKLGSKGAFITNYEEDIWQEPLYRGAPVDTLGCGDAFCSGFIAGYTRGLSLRGCGLMASAAAAKICGSIGCSDGMTSYDELVAHVHDYGYEVK